MGLEFAHVADPPDVVADAVVLDISPIEFATADLLAKFDGFEHRAIGMAAAAHVIDLAAAWSANELPERFD